MGTSNVEKYAKELCNENKKLKSEITDKNCQIEAMNHHIDCLKSELKKVQDNNIKFPSEPIKVAEMLIYATKRRENCMTGKEYDKPVFEKWQLEQIARHLLVYCNSNNG